MPRPEGYRKALRLMKQAEKFGLPVITLVDTPGADHSPVRGARPGDGDCRQPATTDGPTQGPIITAIIGEGGSGGALAIAMADRVLMLENAVYSVVSPEGCASILWNDAGPRRRGRHGHEDHRRGRLAVRHRRSDRPGAAGGATPTVAAAASSERRFVQPLPSSTVLTGAARPSMLIACFMTGSKSTDGSESSTRRRA